MYEIKNEGWTSHIDWKKIEAIIFDIDGTLYDQFGLTVKMLEELFWYFLFHPTKLYDLKILHDFRRARKIHLKDLTDNLERDQYVWAAEISKVSPEKVKKVVEEWLWERPLKHILYHRYPSLMDFIKNLSAKGIRFAFLSDYPARKKLLHLGIPFQHVFSATDKNINCFKPNPRGLLLAAQTLNVSPEHCLVIGNCNELDGEAARRGSFPYLIIGAHKAKTYLYSTLAAEIA